MHRTFTKVDKMSDIHDYIPTYPCESGKIRIIAENKLKQIKNFPHINEKDKFLAFMQEMNNELLGISSRKIVKKQSMDSLLQRNIPPPEGMHDSILYTKLPPSSPSYDSLKQLRTMRACFDNISIARENRNELLDNMNVQTLNKVDDSIHSTRSTQPSTASHRTSKQNIKFQNKPTNAKQKLNSASYINTDVGIVNNCHESSDDDDDGVDNGSDSECSTCDENEYSDSEQEEKQEIGHYSVNYEKIDELTNIESSANHNEPDTIKNKLNDSCIRTTNNDDHTTIIPTKNNSSNNMLMEETLTKANMRSNSNNVIVEGDRNSQTSDNVLLTSHEKCSNYEWSNTDAINQENSPDNIIKLTNNEYHTLFGPSCDNTSQSALSTQDNSNNKVFDGNLNVNNSTKSNTTSANHVHFSPKIAVSTQSVTSGSNIRDNVRIEYQSADFNEQRTQGHGAVIDNNPNSCGYDNEYKWNNSSESFVSGDRRVASEENNMKNQSLNSTVKYTISQPPVKQLSQKGENEWIRPKFGNERAHEPSKIRVEIDDSRYDTSTYSKPVSSHIRSSLNLSGMSFEDIKLLTKAETSRQDHSRTYHRIN